MTFASNASSSNCPPAATLSRVALNERGSVILYCVGHFIEKKTTAAEIKTLRRINSLAKKYNLDLFPKILNIVDSYYLNMEYVGMDLFEMITGDACTNTVAFRMSVARQIAQAVDFLHSHAKLIHMDLKLENIAWNSSQYFNDYTSKSDVESKLRVKIIDFDSAKEIRTKWMKGNLPHMTCYTMAPECLLHYFVHCKPHYGLKYRLLLDQVLDGPNTNDDLLYMCPSNDIWSVGMILLSLFINETVTIVRSSNICRSTLQDCVNFLLIHPNSSNQLDSQEAVLTQYKHWLHEEPHYLDVRLSNQFKIMLQRIILNFNGLLLASNLDIIEDVLEKCLQPHPKNRCNSSFLLTSLRTMHF